jgi:hypothetical protein
MSNDKTTRGRRLAIATLLALMGLWLLAASPALANSAWWSLTSSSWPSTLPASGEGTIEARAQNLGYTRVGSAPVTLSDRLPVGVVPQSAQTFMTAYGGNGKLNAAEIGFDCQIAGQEVTCLLPESLSQQYPIAPYDELELRIAVKVEGAAPGIANQVSVSGGGIAPAAVTRPLTVAAEPTPFGLSDYELTPENADGSVDTQAGSHPFQLTTKLLVNQTAAPGSPPAILKDLHFKIPPGLLGNPTPIPQCTGLQFSALEGELLEWVNACPPDTAIGATLVTLDEPQTGGVFTISAPLFNLKPEIGEPARFGFLVAGVPVILNISIRTGSDYGVTVTVPNISELASFISTQVTFWGVPGDPRHDAARGWSCLAEGFLAKKASLPDCAPLNEAKPPPFLIMPASCTGQLQSTVETDSWLRPGAFTDPLAARGLPAMDSCNQLPFSSSLSVVPDGLAASTPTGLTVGLHVPQEEAVNPNGLAPAQVRNTTVTLPAGVALNPGAGDGLLACSESQVDLTNDTEATCPEASKVATVEVSSPLLPNQLVGEAYLAAQEANPFGSLVALYLVVRDPVSGVLIKLAGEVKPDPVTGQLVSTFLNTPQLPFEDLKLHFFGGSRAPLGMPAYCGVYTTTASLQPWSGNPADQSSSTFTVISGPNGNPCPSQLPFVPELTAGSLNLQAGGLTPFTTTMSRADGNQNLGGIQLHMPPGLSGLLSGVKLCGEVEGNAGTCGHESEIGETIVSVGLGGSPFSVKGGKVFITGPYEGAPFGLSIVNPAKAGPYDLEKNTPCDCVVVRAKIEVDPVTAALTITTDNTGPYKIPTVLDGIPLQIQHVNVTINRPGFTFNPTNCNPMAITGSLQSTEGSSQALSVPFQVTNCATLGFKPGFKVATSGKTTRKTGASLNVKLTYPKSAFGSQANIKSVKVDLPKQLPSRLPTLQKACVAAQFNANPAGCPAASVVGHATAITPLIPVQLTGPAYFVSYGSAKFPELVVVLQGYGVTLDVHGETFIDPKTNITSSTFHTVPDAPVGSFELNLPQGQFSALAANTNLCAVKGGLKMPTQFVAQNGTVIKQSTPISITGCPKHKATKAKHKKANKKPTKKGKK